MSLECQCTQIARGRLVQVLEMADSGRRQARQGGHLQLLTEVRDSGTPSARLEPCSRPMPRSPYSATAPSSERCLHRGEHLVRAQQHLLDLIRDLLVEGAKSGEVRDDIAADEPAAYCLHALSAARDLSSTATVQRLVEVTLTGRRHS
jgi:hypothetical protein